MATTIEVIFGCTENGQDNFSISYKLIQNDFNRRWAAGVQQALNRRRKIADQGHFFGSCFESEPELRHEMTRCIQLINSHRKGSITLVPHPNMTRNFVLKLHEDFERLEPQPDFRDDEASPEVKKALQDLNILIHKYEDLDGPLLTHIDIVWNPVDRFCFEPDDYKMFTTQRRYGELYLAYGVTGVPVMNAFFSRHQGVPVPQYNYTPSMTLGFLNEGPFNELGELDHWLQSNWGWNLKEKDLAIGYISLGQMKPEIEPGKIIELMKKRPKILDVKVSPTPTIEDFDGLRHFSEKTWIPKPAGKRPQRPSFEGPLPQFVVSFQNGDGTSTVDLEFELRDHGVTRKWLKLVEEAVSQRYAVADGGMFSGFKIRSQEDLQTELNLKVAALNKVLPDFFKDIGKNLSDKDLKHDVQTVTDALLDNSTASEDLKKGMHEILKLLYQLQEAQRTDDRGHINLDFNPSNSIPLEGDDFSLFSADEEWGGLYLTYGQFGCPTLNAFYEKRTTPFNPQKSIASGVTMKFYGNFKFHFHEQLSRWLSEVQKCDPEDPTLAIGSIPLGKLRTKRSRDEIFKLISTHPRIKEVKLADDTFETLPEQKQSPSSVQISPSKNSTPATWPHMGEIFRHLEHTPWILLPLPFDHQACYREAAALVDKFVIHRDYDQSSTTQSVGKWKSLGIYSLNGDSTKTYNHADYGVTEPTYQFSEIAAQCPKTVEFLSRLTDFNQCQRVRFMLLEPGAKISVHSDAPDKDTSYAVNIALNMPQDCEFWVDLNKDGTQNSFSKKVPIQDGSIFIFNNAKYHSVENRSNTPRIHIIIHGPIRFSDDEVLQFARKQNGLGDHKVLMNALVSKYALLGQEIKSPLFSEWTTAGVDSQVLSKNIRLAVIREREVSEELEEEVLNKFTLASLFPSTPPIIPMNEVDSWLKNIKNEGATHGVLVTAGTFITNTPTFFVETLKAIHFLSGQNAALMGHIMNRPGNPNDLPFLHEQFLILDLKRWNDLGAVTLGKPYVATEMEMPGYMASPQNIHDDYTPLWLKPNQDAPPRRGKEGFGTRLMAASLEKGYSVVNVPIPLRSTKRYAYPRTGRCYQYEDIKTEIRHFLQREAERVYVFNNETLRILDFPGFKPETFISVAAGFKPFSLLRQFWSDRKPRQISFIDFSRPAVEHLQKLVNLAAWEEILDLLQRELVRQGISPETSQTLTPQTFKAVLREAFDNDFLKLVGVLKMISKAEINYGDFISEPDQVLSRIKPGQQTLFWHSNAWSSNPAYYARSKEDLEKNYVTLGRAVQQKSGLKGWKRTGYHEMIFGNTVDSPQIVITAGGDSSVFNPGIYRPLDGTSLSLFSEKEVIRNPK